jgi:hypothetical protein
MIPRVLFVLKKHEGSGGPLHSSSGLRNSARFVADMLNSENIATASVAIVVDGNGIDAEVFKFKPDVVVLEAIWCPPDKLAELVTIYPKIRWVVRIHSEIPFLAHEGMALQYLAAYASITNVKVSANSPVATRDLGYLNPVFLPNFYPVVQTTSDAVATAASMDHLKVGCFGAVRPMKNQLAQAFAAVEYAKRKRVTYLSFYVNASRPEQGGENVLKNLRSFFASQPSGYQLIEVSWSDRTAFLALVAEMDICMSVSFSETFCIVAADAVSQKIPVVVSPEVFWVDDDVQVDPTDIQAIADTIGHALGIWKGMLLRENLNGLRKYNQQSVVDWKQFLRSS